MLQLDLALRDGLLFCLLMGALILVSLVVNPRIWLNDYPESVRKIAPPLDAREKRQRTAFVIPFLLSALVIPILSTRAYIAASGGEVSFINAYAHTFAILFLFNLFDALVIDYLFLTVMHPRFAIIPEAWNNTETFALSSQVRDFFKGIVLMTVFSAPLAAVAMI
jgi:hypothetical protein